MANAIPVKKDRDFPVILAVWMLLAVTLVFLAWPNISAPGLNYDEAQRAAMAGDFLTGHPHPHMPGSRFVSLWGRPFATFAQYYIGALESWLLMPSFAVFGTSQPVLRLTELGLGLGSLLVFMLWTRRWLGRNTALVAGALLAFDPTFFFISVLDWGLVLPSFFCRFACFYFGLRWWQLGNETPTPEQDDSAGKLPSGTLQGVLADKSIRRLTPPRMQRGYFCAFLSGLFAGLGFFNKIDFGLLIAGVVLALLCCNARHLWGRNLLRQLSVFWKPLALVCLGFLLTAGPMLMHIPSILGKVPSLSQAGRARGELTEKFNAMLAMYDGSYFYRMMDTGGMFERMYQARAPVFAPIGIAVILAAVSLVFRFGKDSIQQGPHPPGNLTAQKHSGGESLGEGISTPRFRLMAIWRACFRGEVAFLLLAILFISLGILLVPGAMRIHHMVLVYPFPHLAVALAVTRLWQRRRGAEPVSAGQNALAPSFAWAAALFVLLLACELLALHRTQRLIQQTGGRGRWSDALNAFARQVNGRTNLTIVSMDWGFNEQLAFLTDGPKLKEPFWWGKIVVNPSTNLIYLAHPTNYSLFPCGLEILRWSRGAGPGVVEVQPWCDHQDQVAFYSLRFRSQ